MKKLIDIIKILSEKPLQSLSIIFYIVIIFVPFSIIPLAICMVIQKYKKGGKDVSVL